VAGFVFGQDAARGAIVYQLSGLIGPEGARTIQELLKSASRPSTSAIASMVGVVMLLLGASSVFAELQTSLDRIWRAPALKRPEGVIALIRSRLLSFGMVVAIGFLLLVSLVLSAVLSAADRWGGTLFPAWQTVLQIVNLAVGFGLTTLLFAMAYRILPRVRIAWADVWVGSVVTAALFTAGKFLIGLYIGRAGISSSFGAAGSFVVLLAWVYYSSQIFLLGAEFTWVYAHSHGSRAGLEPPPAPPIPIAPVQAPEAA
jgi:membrane protein